ncbi:MAG: hypothetical protein ACPGYF_06285 [Chitinophagales bacterium]
MKSFLLASAVLIGMGSTLYTSWVNETTVDLNNESSNSMEFLADTGSIVYESRGDENMGKERMTRKIKMNGKVSWVYWSEALGQRNLGYVYEDGYEYVYFSGNSKSKYKLIRDRCGFTCVHPDGDTQFYRQVKPACR